MTQEALVVAETPAAPPPTTVATPEAPAGETPAPHASGTPPAPAGETPAKPDENSDKEAKHRRRLNTAYRKAAEAQARADFLEKQLSEYRAKAAPASEPGAPKLESFDDIEKYAEARAKYESEKAVKAHQAQQQSESHKQQQARLTESWETKAERAGVKYEDFDEVVGDIKPTNPWTMALMEAENGEDIAYHLGKNLKEAQRIAALPPLSQIREIGKLEAKLAAEPPKPKTPSRAPAPITPVTGAAPVVTDVPSENDDIGPWIKKRSKQVHKR